MPLDDFDRSLTEASVRLLAGSMLELVKHEVEVLDDEEEVSSRLSDYFGLTVAACRHYLQIQRRIAILRRSSAICDNI